MINVFILFSYIVFKEKLINAMVWIPHYSPKVLGLNLFMNSLFHS